MVRGRKLWPPSSTPSRGSWIDGNDSSTFSIERMSWRSSLIGIRGPTGRGARFPSCSTPCRNMRCSSPRRLVWPVGTGIAGKIKCRRFAASATAAYLVGRRRCSARTGTWYGGENLHRGGGAVPAAYLQKAETARPPSRAFTACAPKLARRLDRMSWPAPMSSWRETAVRPWPATITSRVTRRIARQKAAAVEAFEAACARSQGTIAPWRAWAVALRGDRSPEDSGRQPWPSPAAS